MPPLLGLLTPQDPRVRLQNSNQTLSKSSTGLHNEGKPQ